MACGRLDPALDFFTPTLVITSNRAADMLPGTVSCRTSARSCTTPLVGSSCKAWRPHKGCHVVHAHITRAEENGMAYKMDDEAVSPGYKEASMRHVKRAHHEPCEDA
jgi:hypothetical protein